MKNENENAAEIAEKEIDFAEREFINYCEANEIDHDEMAMDDDDRKTFVKMKNRFMKAVNEKRLIVDGTTLVYTVSRFSQTEGEKLTIARPTGKDFIAMDGFKDTQQMQKFNALSRPWREKKNSMSRGLTLPTANFYKT